MGLPKTATAAPSDRLHPPTPPILMNTTYWLLLDVSVLFGVMLLTGIIIPQILLIAFRKNLFDTPDPRKIHKTEIPRLGGIAFFPSILLVFFLLYGFGIMIGNDVLVSYLLRNIQPICFFSAGAILLYLTGMADDLVGVKYRAKFIVQILSAVFVIIGGLEMDSLHGFLGIYGIPQAIAIPLTVLLIVFITNAINLIDGIDGLASGLSAIACAFYAFVFINAELYIFSALAVAVLGTLIPFFVYNVFGNPAKHRKIFMGDTGALTVGLFLSVMCLRLCQLEKVTDGVNPAVIALAPLLIPCLDVVRVYLHRLRAHRNPFLPDKTHIHHKLLAAGMGQRTAMMAIIGSSALWTAANYWLSHMVDITVLFVCDLALWILVNNLLCRSIRSREKALSQTLYE